MNRLVTAVIVEEHDEWQVADKRYLSEGSMAALKDGLPAITPSTTMAVTRKESTKVWADPPRLHPFAATPTIQISP